jgi:glutathione S-transferase
MRPRLTYFDIRGRAEPIRLLLADHGVDYDDIRVTPREFQAIKHRTPFGQLPIWEESGHLIAQSRVILWHLAEAHLEPARDAQDRIRRGEAEAAVHELFERVVRLCWSRSFAEDQPIFAAQVLGRFLPALDAHLGRGGAIYWGGDEPAVADYMAWNLLDDLRRLAPDAVPANRRLQRLWETFGERPQIAAYVAQQRPATIALPHASFGGRPEES